MPPQSTPDQRGRAHMQSKITYSKANGDKSGQKNLTSIVFSHIRSDILLGHLRPNERLRIQGLSDRYEVGATAIREALSRLLSDGLVDSEDQRGFFVTPVSRDEIRDLTQTRSELEGLALTKSMQLGDVNWESQVLSAFHRLFKCPLPSLVAPAQLANWSATHREFHETLIAGCQSPWLRRLCALLYDKTERYRNLSGKRSDAQDRDINAEHRRLMEATLSRDVELACQLLSDHFWETTNLILGIDFDEFNNQ